MTGEITSSQIDNRCWSDIGVWGNRSCPKLSELKHCRNCEVYSHEGQQLLNRSAPRDYLDMWGGLLAKEKLTASVTVPYAVFRVGRSWLALDSVFLVEIKPPGAIRSLPHVTSQVLLGVTAVRGEIYLCASLHRLIKEEYPLMAPGDTRFLVTRHRGAAWVFPVDEVGGVHDLDKLAIEALPATLTHAEVVYTRGIAQLSDYSVGLIDENLLFNSLARIIA